MMMGLSRLVGAGGAGVSSSSMMMGLSRLVGAGVSTSKGTALKPGASVTLTGGATAITVEASSRGVARGFFDAGVVEGASGCFRLPAPRAAATAASTWPASRSSSAGVSSVAAVREPHPHSHVAGSLDDAEDAGRRDEDSCALDHCLQRRDCEPRRVARRQ